MYNKRIVAGVIFWLFCFGAVLPLYGNQLDFFVHYARFLDEERKPYVELYYSVYAFNVLHNQNAEGNYRAKVQLEFELIRLSDSSVVYDANSTLKGFELPDTAGLAKNYFLMDQYRYRLEPGQYLLKARARDLGAADSVPHTRVWTEFEIEDPQQHPRYISDFQFYQKMEETTPPSESEFNPFYKYGYQVTPAYSGDLFVQQDSLRFLCEFYDLDSLLNGEPYFISLSILPGTGSRKLVDYSKLYRPRMPKDFALFRGDFDIRMLPNQTYQLLLEIKLNDGTLMASRKQNIYVDNGLESLEEVAAETDLYDYYYGYTEAQLDSLIPALAYIATPGEESFMKGLRTYKEKKDFFYTFWKRRRSSDDSPIGAEWYRYKEAIDYANREFTTNIREGWKSDRGRVLLKYGPPNDLERFDDPLVYEIWTYNELDGQNGVYFVFWNRERASNELLLVHSTKRGETFNPEWKEFLDDVSSPRNSQWGNRPVSIPGNTTGGTRFGTD